jgi:hypothetical protein
MATRTKTPKTSAEFRAAALKAAQAAITKGNEAKGWSKEFAAHCVALAAIGTDDAKAEAEGLGKDLDAIPEGGKGYAANARRILAVSPATAAKVLDACTDPKGKGWSSAQNLFKRFAEEFPTLTDSGRKAKPEANKAAANDGVSLNTPAGWKLACVALCANVQGLKTWTADDIDAARDSAKRILALIDRNKT